jgi:hypothetical protein
MPLDYHNWVNRNLKPVAEKMGIRVNCQIMRRCVVPSRRLRMKLVAT